MHLIICVSCGHPAIYHEADGCAELQFLTADGCPEECDCPLTEAAVMRQVVPPLPGLEE